MAVVGRVFRDLDLGDASTLVTSWSQLESLVASGQVSLVRDAAADFRCPVLGNSVPVG